MADYVKQPVNSSLSPQKMEYFLHWAFHYFQTMQVHKLKGNQNAPSVVLFLSDVLEHFRCSSFPSDFRMFSLVCTLLILISGMPSDGKDESSLTDEVVEELSLTLVSDCVGGTIFSSVPQFFSAADSVFCFILNIFRSFSVSSSSCFRNPLSMSVSSLLWSKIIFQLYNKSNLSYLLTVNWRKNWTILLLSKFKGRSDY